MMLTIELATFHFPCTRHQWTEKPALLQINPVHFRTESKTNMVYKHFQNNVLITNMKRSHPSADFIRFLLNCHTDWNLQQVLSRTYQLLSEDNLPVRSYNVTLCLKTSFDLSHLGPLSLNFVWVHFMKIILHEKKFTNCISIHTLQALWFHYTWTAVHKIHCDVEKTVLEHVY